MRESLIELSISFIGKTEDSLRISMILLSIADPIVMA